MTFVEDILGRLEQARETPLMREVRAGRLVAVTASEFLTLVSHARGFLSVRGFEPGDRCALIAANSIRWAALDLAILAEGLVTVPLYARQAVKELAAMLNDSTPRLIICEESLLPEVRRLSARAAEIVSLDAMFQAPARTSARPFHHAEHDAVTIIYTSGTSGEPKGVVLNSGNVNHILGCTHARLDQLMGRTTRPDQIFHYLPFCFAGSWILLLTALSRSSVLTLSTDLTKLADEWKLAAPDYLLNVPILVERVRAKVEEAIARRGGWANHVFSRARQEYVRGGKGRSGPIGSLCLWLASKAIFPSIRQGIGGPNLRALICGSAPLSVDTQSFFIMLGIPVLQSYGLTETTAICTLDDPRHVVPGRVGPTIPGIEMTLADNGEVLVRGPNIFPGYWQRPAETAKALDGGWFHSGDQGEVDASGNWRITGRLKNLIILNSGHNIAPEPIEDTIAARLPEAQQVMLLGNQRSFLAALVAAGANGSSKALDTARIQAVLDDLNAQSPHYKQIRAFHVVPEPFSVESGLLTANGKLKRDAIAARFAAEIESLYSKRSR
ncbi:MAG TPA: AMP-binding protein [Candidatus Acidoferrales bacterium]|nr:AMP-binding protein [Candidatus Acidoferrales bacterium]